MKRMTTLTVALAGALTFAACADDNARMNTASGTTGTAGTAADVDREWVADQLEDGDREVRLGRLAQEKGSDAAVRQYGEMMVEHHTMAGTELKRVADRHGIAAADDDRGENDRDFERLSALNGAEFDRAYLETMVEDHEDALDEIERKAGDPGSSDEHADVKAWADKTLPTVRDHLERAKSLRERLPNKM